MENSSAPFIKYWQQIVVIWSEIAVAAAILIVLYYLIRRALISKRTVKYEFISANEVRFFWYAALALSIGFTFFFNGLIVKEHVTESQFILSIKTFLSLAIGFGVGYFFNTYLHVYYPFKLEKKLHDIRFKPRKSPDGNEMKLLTEDEEDVHMTQEMIHHEKISAYEYDVWIDEKSGYKIIEKYNGSLYDLICDSCNYRTLHEVDEEVIQEPKANESGILRKHYKCSYCGHKEDRESNIAPLSEN
ncbi:MAG: hypothetical protein JXR07_01555 [Reichenbachiella sp.]